MDQDVGIVMTFGAASMAVRLTLGCLQASRVIMRNNAMVGL
jgi:hypothetical protein